MFHKPVDASGDGEFLLESERSQFPMSWSPHGDLLAFEEYHPDSGIDIWLLPRDGSPQSFLVSAFNEHSPRFSPDGRFIAYVSNESGRDEVYVQHYPSTGRKYTISTDGGSEPLWSRNGRELFYRNGDAVMGVDLEPSEEFRPGAPHLLFEGQYVADIFPNWDISPDGQRFLMVQSETPPAREIRVVLNWFEELKELVPVN
jgi:dipeptidyl aminopeptidase/acylaminoacyl peptidase